MFTQNLPETWAVVPAAGIGSRMQAELPKQYLRIEDKTILDLTIEKLLALPELAGVVVTLHPEDQWWPESNFASHPKVHICGGGDERSESVALGLAFVLRYCSSEDDVWALVHDAARPCVSLEKIYELIQVSLSDKLTTTGGILAAPCADTVKRVKDGFVTETEDRSELYLAHTPQFFPAEKLLQCIETALVYDVAVTDEASAIEAAGGKVAIVPDRRDNIKITLPEDLLWAETILQKQKEESKS